MKKTLRILLASVLLVTLLAGYSACALSEAVPGDAPAAMPARTLRITKLLIVDPEAQWYRLKAVDEESDATFFLDTREGLSWFDNASTYIVYANVDNVTSGGLDFVDGGIYMNGAFLVNTIVIDSQAYLFLLGNGSRLKYYNDSEAKLKIIMDDSFKPMDTPADPTAPPT